MSLPRVLLVQPSLQPPGGGNAVAAWILQALAGRCEMSVLTWIPADLAEVNSYYGTTIRPGDVRLRSVYGAVRVLVERFPTPAVLFKSSLLFRAAKRIAPDYELVLCAHNETDLGPRCIQYVHYPARLRPRPEVDLRWYHAWELPLYLYYRLCERITHFQEARVPEALTLANSTWTAALLRKRYGRAMEPLVVPPPVDVDASPVPWARRSDGFVCIGRISPEKELERVIAILAAVRKRRPSARLHLLGSRGPKSYLRRIRRLAGSQGDWVRLHVDVPRAELLRLIHENRYAIHGMREEHFGIAPAEALLGGCIVFVPNGGGQTDIVGDEPLLRYDTIDDAAEKIVRVMEDVDRQRALLSHLAARRHLFTRKRFTSRIQALVDERLARFGGTPLAADPGGPASAHTAS